VATVKLYLTERPATLAAACARVPSLGLDAHAVAVGVPAVLGAPLAIAQQETVQVQRTQAQWSSDQAEQRGNGFATKAIGMDSSSVVTGVKVNGAPPRGKPV
jgi:hypothetical protein